MLVGRLLEQNEGTVPRPRTIMALVLGPNGLSSWHLKFENDCVRSALDSELVQDVARVRVNGLFAHAS